MFEITLSKDATKSFTRMPANDRKRIITKIENLASDPYAPNNNVQALIGVAGYRLRVGDYRIIYSLEDTMRIMFVEKIASRGSIYND